MYYSNFFLLFRFLILRYGVSQYYFFHLLLSFHLSLLLLPPLSPKTCHNHLNLSSLIFLAIEAIPMVHLVQLLLTLSFLVTPLSYLNILISATLILCSIFLSIIRHSNSYSIAGLNVIKSTFKINWNRLITQNT